jgi:hypothetical protein
MASCPSLDKLRDLDRQRWIRRKESKIRRDAERLGVKNPHDKDLWALLRRVHRAKDELERPEVEARARLLGVPTRGLFFGKRQVWEIRYDCHREEERHRLCADLGFVRPPLPGVTFPACSSRR